MNYYDEGVEYNGEFPLDDEYMAQCTVYSQTYLNRIKESFEGQPEEVPTSLAEFSITERRYILAHYGDIAEDEQSYNYMGVGERVVIKHETNVEQHTVDTYMYFLDESDSEVSGKTDGDGNAIETKKWYIMPETTGDFYLYNGSAPVSSGDFSSIYCQSYFDRVLASFNNP